MEDAKNLEVNFNDSQEALYEIQLELDELMMALSILTDDYDTSFELNEVDLKKYMQGEKNNDTGKMSFKFLYEHKRLMWLVRTAKMYCEEAKRICEAAQF